MYALQAGTTGQVVPSRAVYGSTHPLPYGNHGMTSGWSFETTAGSPHHLASQPCNPYPTTRLFLRPHQRSHHTPYLPSCHTACHTFSFDESELPTHPALQLVSNSEQLLTLTYSRRLITMQKVHTGEAHEPSYHYAEVVYWEPLYFFPGEPLFFLCVIVLTRSAFLSLNNSGPIYLWAHM